MDNIIQHIRTLAKDFHADTIAIRRYIHQHPNLSGYEQETANFVVKTLAQYGIESQKVLDNNAVIAYIRSEAECENTPKHIALRADMDALPIEEQNDCKYKSIYSGIMHACGHDVHTASLLTVARILNQLKHCFCGTVQLIFQPSEEVFPGGAIELIKGGYLDNPKPDLILGCHVSPEIETGKIGFKAGNYMASTDEIYLTVIGQGGHAAVLNSFINPLIISSKILLELETFCATYAPKDILSILTFGRIMGEGKTNIVPDKVLLEGTFRTFNEEWRKRAHGLIAQVASRIAQSMGGKTDLLIDKGYPVLTNHPQWTKKCTADACDFLGKENVLTLDYRMTAEDFAYYSHYIPAVFYRVGTKINNRPVSLHSANFDVNEDALLTAPAIMSYLTVKGMKENSNL